MFTTLEVFLYTLGEVMFITMGEVMFTLGYVIVHYPKKAVMFTILGKVIFISLVNVIVHYPERTVMFTTLGDAVFTTLRENSHVNYTGINIHVHA